MQMMPPVMARTLCNGDNRLYVLNAFRESLPACFRIRWVKVGGLEENESLRRNEADRRDQIGLGRLSGDSSSIGRASARAS